MKRRHCISALVLTGAIFVALIKPLNAQEKAAADKVAPIARQLGGWHDILSARKSLSLVALESGHVEPGFGHDASPDFTGTFKLFYLGDRFLYDVEVLSSKIYSQVESFDGAHYERLDRSGELRRSSQRFVNDVVMCQGHVFFMPFLFLQSGFSVDPFAQLSYDQLTKKDDWKNVLASLPATSGVEEVNLGNEQYLKITNIGENVDPVSGQACVFDVYFAKSSHWYPMKWERRLVTGNIVTSYAVEELGFIKMENGENIPYPKISVLKHYQDGKLRDTERLEVQQISFDTVRDADVSIDPASVRLIRDLDSGAKIQVAK